MAETCQYMESCSTPRERFLAAFTNAEEGTPFDVIYREAFPEQFETSEEEA